MRYGPPYFFAWGSGWTGPTTLPPSWGQGIGVYTPRVYPILVDTIHVQAGKTVDPNPAIETFRNEDGQ